MTRIARVVLADSPHHITQRGNNRQDVFFVDDDYRVYLRLLAAEAGRHGLDVFGYCLMTNHVHLIATPANETALAKALGRTHWVYARYVNRLHGRSGHLWQNRFYSCALDEGHLWKALAYIERNPVRAGLVGQAWEYRWSSARAHCGVSSESQDSHTLRDCPDFPPDCRTENQDSHILRDCPDFPLDMAGWRRMQTAGEWQAALCEAEDAAGLRRIRSQTRRGWPLGSDDFLSRVEKVAGRRLRPLPVGRPGK